MKLSRGTACSPGCNLETIEEVDVAMAVAPSGGLVLSALEKWTALRTMHEEYGVPLSVLRPMAVCAQEYFAKMVADQKWQNGSSSSTMLTRLSAAAESQLTRFGELSIDACEEKRARALAVMAKTLETITAIETRLGAVAMTGGDRAHNASNRDKQRRNANAGQKHSADATANNIAARRRKIEAVLEGLEKFDFHGPGDGEPSRGDI